MQQKSFKSSGKSSEVIKNIAWLAYQQGTIFRKFNKKEKFAKMITEFGVSRSTISFKIALVGLMTQYPKMITLIIINFEETYESLSRKFVKKMLVNLNKQQNFT